MQILYEKFYKSIRWNAFESLTYHGILLGHQIMLFKVLDSALYGLVGALFSIIYMTITVTNFGLDNTLAPFFLLVTKSKAHFKRILIPQLIPEITLLAIISSTIYFWSPFLQSFIARVPFHATIPFLIGMLIFTEGLKKTVRVFLQLAFLNHKTAPLEIITIIAYCSTIWSLYAIGHTLTVFTILFPMLIYSLIGLMVLCYFMYHYYASLPESSVHSEQDIMRRIIRSRFFNYLNQLTHTLFSGNFLVPIFALHFGLSLAGFFKLISTIVHTLTTILHKVFGLTIEAFFSHAKETGINVQQEIFNTVTSQLYHALYGITIFFIINHKIILTTYGYGGHDTPLSSSLIALFFIVPLSEHFFMVYEKFSITHERSDYFFGVNIVTLLIFYAVIHWGISWGPLAILCALLTIRLLSLTAMSVLSVRTWNLYPSWHFKRNYIVASMVISFIFFALAHYR